jgi:hypothetical protein
MYTEASMRFLLLALIIAAPGLASAKTVSCQVDDLGGTKISVPVAVAEGAFDVKEQPVTFKGGTFSVLWQKGDQFETQTSLRMKFDNSTSTMYDFVLDGHFGPINVIEHNGVRFQCWVE